MENSLCLEHMKTTKYLKGPATWWDIDPKDDAQVDEGPDEIQLKLVGVPFSMIGNANTRYSMPWLDFFVSKNPYTRYSTQED